MTFSIKHKTIKQSIIAMLPFGISLLLTVVLYNQLAAFLNSNSWLHDGVGGGDSRSLLLYIIATVGLHLIAVVLLLGGSLASAVVLKAQGVSRPKRLALRAAITALGSGMAMLYASVWLPDITVVASIITTLIVYAVVIAKQWHYPLRYAVMAAVGLVIVVQLVLAVVPAYRYVYASGTVYMPPATNSVEQYDSPLVDAAPLYRAIPGLPGELQSHSIHAGSMTGLFGLLPGDGTTYYPDSKLGGVTVYQARANALRYQPSKCPNIQQREELIASPCEYVGKNAEGGAIYAYSPSLPSGTTVAYSVIGDTFVALEAGFMADGQYAVEYIRSLEAVPASQVHARLSENKKQAARAQHALDREVAAAKKRDGQAYKNLPFQLPKPAELPKDWRLNRPFNEAATVYGASVEKPTMVGYSYQGPGKYDYVNFFAVKRDLVQLGINGTCGQTPGQGGEYLACHKVPGTNYFTATNSGELFIDELRYIDLGDVVVIAVTGTSKVDDNTGISKVPQYLLDAQAAMIAQFNRVDNKELEGAEFTTPIIEGW
jgi:hypothetical protein